MYVVVHTVWYEGSSEQSSAVSEGGGRNVCTGYSNDIEVHT